jgi:hypothetical protein
MRALRAPAFRARGIGRTRRAGWAMRAGRLGFTMRALRAGLVMRAGRAGNRECRA